LVGYLLSWGLYGALSVQVYIYYLAFPKDRLAHKLLVYGVFLVETLQAVLVAHDVFASFVDGFDNFQVLTDMHFAWFTMPVLSGIVALCVQLFYAFRIVTLSKSKVLALLQMAGALISGVEGVRAGNLLKLTSKLDHIGHAVSRRFFVRIITKALGSGVCDIVIAVCMAFYLSRMDSGSVKSTHAAVSKIIRLVVGTGALTGMVAIIDISLYYSGSPKHKAWFLTPAVILGRLYSNSMMVIFNSRVEIVGGRGQTATLSDVALSNSTLGSFRPSDPNGTLTESTYLESKHWDQQGVNLYYICRAIKCSYKYLFSFLGHVDCTTHCS
ncbi:hypothetical protein BDZ94DRAFT_1169258, partial [Collybia nuda]